MFGPCFPLLKRLRKWEIVAPMTKYELRVAGRVSLMVFLKGESDEIAEAETVLGSHYFQVLQKFLVIRGMW